MQFRQALSRPMPAERDYLEAQFTGVGVLIGQQQARWHKQSHGLSQPIILCLGTRFWDLHMISVYIPTCCDARV